MNSIGGLAGGTNIKFGGYNRRLSSAGYNTARRKSSCPNPARRPSISPMAAAAAAAHQSVTGHHDDKETQQLLDDVEDPILARTITVDESFRRMEVRHLQYSQNMLNVYT